MADAYLNQILAREAVDTSITSPVRRVAQVLAPAIQAWGGQYIAGIRPSGSFAKGTANRSGTDIDLFLSLRADTPDTLHNIYNSLAERMRISGYTPRRQNVSINVKVEGQDVDLVPGKLQNAYSSDHSLWRNRASTWTKTNIDAHVAKVIGSGRQPEIRLIKLWRNQNGLDFPSFYLELTVIEALRNSLKIGPAAKVLDVLIYIRDRIEIARVVDPANGANVISDDTTSVDKRTVARAAASALKASNWKEILR